MIKTCTINGVTHRIGDVVIDPTGKRAPVAHVHQADGWRWFIVRVNPNCDDRATQSLGARGYRTIQPRQSYTTVRHRQTVVAHRSVFPRYLFLGLPFFRRGGRDEIDFVTPCRCDGVEGLLRTAGAPLELRVRDRGTGAIVTGEQIAMAFVMWQSGASDESKAASFAPLAVDTAPLQPHPMFAKGQNVSLRKGPLAGFVATVMRAEANKRIDVLLHMLGGTHRLRFKARELELVG